MKHKDKALQISTQADLDPCALAVSRQLQELQATITESKDAVERGRWLIEHSNKLLDRAKRATKL